VRERVRIEGAGPAACAAIIALRQGGFPIDLRMAADGPISPPLVINEGTIALLGDLCGGSGLFARAHQLRRRIVCWGDGPPTVMMEPAVSIPGAQFRQALLEIATARLGADYRVERAPTAANHIEAGWTLCAAATAAPAGSRIERYGGRVMLCAEVGLSSAAEADTCWIEAGARGWVFLAPLGPRRGVVQAALPQAPENNDATALAEIVGAMPRIAALVAEIESPVQVHRIAPAVRHPLAGDNWMALGSTAMTLDPICGDGTGQALRSGLLAAATVTAVADGGDRRALVAHFTRRLLRSFGAHLAACSRFYDPALFGPSWQGEIAETQAAAAAFASARETPPEFALQNLRLVPIS
jgi:hypothetical protein